MSPRLYTSNRGVSLSTRTYWLGLQRLFHRHLLDLVRLGDERLDDEEDDKGQDQRLDDFERDTRIGVAFHGEGSIGTVPLHRRRAATTR